MKAKLSIWILLLHIASLLSACSLPMTLTVLDQESKKPIEGASCIAYWDVMEIGGSYRTAKIVEDKTDVKGKFRVPMVIGLKSFTKPDIKIYKPGYVGWDSNYIYKGHQVDDIRIPLTDKRKNFGYKSQNISLERYGGRNVNYSRYSHLVFLSDSLPSFGDMSDVGIKFLQFREEIRRENPSSEKYIGINNVVKIRDSSNPKPSRD